MPVAFLHDVAYACRTLRRAPGLVVTAVLSLGLGLAATTAVFSFVNALQFKDLPFADPATLVDVEETSTTELCAGCAVGTSFPTLQTWRADARSFTALAAYQETRVVLSVPPEMGTVPISAPTGASEMGTVPISAPPERVAGAVVSADLFPTIGVQPSFGRTFSAQDDTPGAEPVALLSDALWRRRFDADPGVLGRAIVVDGAAYTIVGVMPAGFKFPEFAQVWLPLAPARHTQPVTDRSLGVVGRLKPGVSVARAEAEMRTLARGAWSVRVRDLHRAMTEESAAPAAVLLGAVGFVLLIACANVSNLLLVRASERARELSIRVAIGASRMRVARLVLAESLTLGVIGGVVGLTLALWANRAIVASFGIAPPYWIRFGVDWRVFAFSLGMTLVTSVLFGVAPALVASRRDPQDALKEGGGATSRRARRVAGGLVIAQLALALTLLAGAGVLIKTIVRSMRFDPGYDAARVLEGDVSLPVNRYATPQAINAFVNGVLEQLAAVPGARAAVQSETFFGGFGVRSRQVTVEGLASVPEGASPRFYFSVTPGYFTTLGVRVRQGRDFDARDGAGAMVVNEEMAARLWPGASPLGRRVRFGDKPWRTVVGVVSNLNGGIRGRANPLAYVPFASEPGSDLALMISSSAASADVGALTPSLRSAVRAIDPDQPVEDIMTMAAAFREQLQPSRFVARLMSALSCVALALASVGLYGVTSYGVRRRLREIGIRLALGGTSTGIVRLIVGSAWRVIAPGIVLGVAVAVAGTRALQGLLFGTSPTDPVVFAIVIAALAVVASVASYVPARRAARVDPLIVLRSL